MSSAALLPVSSWNRSQGIIMNVKQVLIAVSILASAGGAMAVEATQWNPPAGQATRAEVKADLARAAASGELEARGEAYAGVIDSHAASSTLARGEVRQQLANAQAHGELAARGEAYGGFPQVHEAADYRPVFAFRKPHAQNVN
jgi:hypothetical protein